MCTTNVLVALRNIIENNNNELLQEYSKYTDNRANTIGDALEFYLKDAFCNAFDMEFSGKDKQYSKYLSYLGNKNNPPDFIVKNSIAVEVKKVNWSKKSFPAIALNSSYPKDKLYSDSTLINKECRDCESEEWEVKEMFYAIGSVSGNSVKELWLVDGECYCADNSSYERIKNLIKNGVESTNGVEFTKTNELGKIKKIDPLGITDLRIRGMWNIEHPRKVFDYLIKDELKESRFKIYCLMLKNKYQLLNDEDKKLLINRSDLVNLSEVKIKNPNNPAKFIDAVFIKIDFDKNIEMKKNNLMDIFNI